jgi:hypothetical protein
MKLSTAIQVPDPSAALSARDPNPDRLEIDSDDAEDAVHIDLWFRDRDVVTAINAHPEGVCEVTTFGLRSGLECSPFSKLKDGSIPKVSGMRVIA